MSGIREEKKKATRKAIMDAAIKLFGEKGYDRTSIEDIATEAGVGKGTIYGYFATKREIFQGFCDEEVECSFQRLNDFDDPDAPLLDQLVLLFMTQFRFVVENREFGRHMLREMAFPKEVTEKSVEHGQRYIDTLEELMGRARDRGQIRPDVDLLTASASFYMLYFGCLSAWYSGHLSNLQMVEESMERLFRQTLEGIGT